MLAGQSTSVLRSLIMEYLKEYRGVLEEVMPNAGNRAAAVSVVSHQMRLMEEMPPAALANLFLRAKQSEVATRTDDQMTRDLLEIE